MSCFNVELKKVIDESYEIEIGFNLFDQLMTDIKNGLVGNITKFAVITDSVVKDEVVRLAILKEIFYRFCVKSKESIENFKFNYRNEKDSKTIIEELMNYESILYNENKKSESVIFAINDGYRQIKETDKVITTITLVAMSKLGWKYKTKAYQILKEYLTKNNVKGNLVFIYDGNENEEIGYVNEHHKSNYTMS